MRFKGLRNIQELKKAYPQEITLPRGVDDPVLLLITCEDERIAKKLKHHFLSYGYAIAGPAYNSDMAHSLSRKIPIDGFVYHLGNDLGEILSFFKVLQEFSFLPVVFLGQIDATVRLRIKKLENPYFATDYPIADQPTLLKEMNRLFGNRGGTIPELLIFANATFNEMVSLARRKEKREVEHIISEIVGQLPSRWDSFAFENDPSPTLIYLSQAPFDRSQFFVMLELLFNDLEETINDKLNVTWGADFINDAILQAIARYKFKDELVLNFAKVRGLPDLNIKQLVQKVTEAEGFIGVGYIELSDHGPELLKMKADPGLEMLINEQTVAQLISIVGQGESYREGQFGIVPLLQSQDYVAILSSKILDSETLEDIRMAGRSLTLIFVVIHKNFSNLAMDKSFLKETMSEYYSLDNVKQVTDELIENIYQKFKFILPVS